jgi:hypothetical protein
MNPHPLRCRCGTVRGEVARPERAMGRGVCYCKDCQAYAHFLGRPADVLDALGGTDVVATHPKHVSLTQGRDAIACMSLSPRGLLRWYASCCRTPIGNTSRSHKTAYIGLVHNCLDDPERPIDGSFGPVAFRVNTKSAKGPAASTPAIAMVGPMVGFIGALLRARLDGSYKRTPFFAAESGAPIVAPQVITRAERERLVQSL